MAPEPTTLTVRDSAGSPYRLDNSQTSKASSALLKQIQKTTQAKKSSAAKQNLLGDGSTDTLNAEPIWLVLSTKKHIVPQTRLKPSKILLPHSLNASPHLSICLITPESQRIFKDLFSHPAFPADLSKRITRVIDIKKLKAKYQSFESRKALRDSHDVFLADDRIITYLSKTLGKDFYSSATKRPIPVHLAAYKPKTEKKNAALPSTKPKKENPDPRSVTTPESAAREIERTLSTTQVYLSPSATTSVRVGLSSQTPQQLVENVEAVVQSMTEKSVPRQWRGVQAIHIKGPNTMALPLWLANELWDDESKVLEDREFEERRSRGIEHANKKKKRKGLGGEEQLAIENEPAEAKGLEREVNEEEEARKAKKRKRSAVEADLSKEMRERREKLREQKRKIQASMDEVKAS